MKKKPTTSTTADPPFAIPNWPDMNADRRLFIDRPFGMPLDEVWKPIPGFAFYQASSKGRIRSLDRTEIVSSERRNFSRSKKGVVLKPFEAGGDSVKYLYVKLGSQKIGVHRLVAMAFHGIPPTPRHHAAHRNGKSQDNDFLNIRWATPSENNYDMATHGTAGRGGALKGSLHHKAKLNDDKVRKIRSLFTGTRGEKKELAAKFGVHVSTISAIIERKGWGSVT